jgi:hypothetical protein
VLEKALFIKYNEVYGTKIYVAVVILTTEISWGEIFK